MNTIRSWLQTLTALACLGSVPSWATESSSATDTLEKHFEMLKVGELAFTNVWVFRQTNFNVLIRHSRGIHTIKLTDLPADELAELRSQVGDLAALEPATKQTNKNAWREKLQAVLKDTSPRTLAIAGAALVLVIGLVIVRRSRAETAPPA